MKKHNHNYNLFVKGYSYITSAYCVGCPPKFRFTVLRKEMIRIFLSVSIMVKVSETRFFPVNWKFPKLFSGMFPIMEMEKNSALFPYVNRKPVFGCKP